MVRIHLDLPKIMNTKQQAMIGIGRAMEYYTKRNIPVFVPISDCSRFDLVIDDNGLKRVEVKTCNSKNSGFMLRTNGGNQSWNGKTKYLSSKDCDRVFLCDIRRNIVQEFDITELEGRSSIKLRGSVD